jgi:hypothetical protein
VVRGWKQRSTRQQYCMAYLRYVSTRIIAPCCHSRQQFFHLNLATYVCNLSGQHLNKKE